MVFTGYLELGGREIVNGGRTSAYCARMLPTLDVSGCTDCEDLYEALGHKAYATPLVDQPGWFDADNPDTWNFYGLYPLSFEGFEDSTSTATVTEFIYEGGVVSAPRRATRSLRVTGLLIGLDEAAVSAGMTWLRQVLRPGGCGVNRSCAGDHLSYFSSCPPLCLDSPDLATQIAQQQATNTPLRECATGAILAPLSQCAQPFERHLYNSVTVDGPRITEVFDPLCGSMVRVEFTIVAGVPSPFGTAQQVTSVAVLPGDLPTIGDFTCAPSNEGTVVQRTNAAPNPGPNVTTGGWQSLDTGSWTNGWSTTVVHTTGARSAKSTRTVEGGWAPLVVGAATFIGGYDTIPGALPVVNPGITYTISVWARAEVAAHGYLEVQGLSPDGANTGPVSVATGVDVPANTWVRLVNTVTPAAGVAALRVAARMEVTVVTALVTKSAYFTEALVEVATGPASYFDGSKISGDSTVKYSWVGEVGHSPSRQVQTVSAGVINDQDCPPVPVPPRPPVIDESCITDVVSYKRFTVAIPASVVPRWSDLVPIVNLTTAATAVRQLRVRFYSNPAGLSVPELVQCDFVGEFIVSYLPPNSTMTIDGTAQEVVVVGPTGLPQTASHLLYGSGGGPMVWPYMSCGSQYDMAIDIDPGVTGLQFELCVAARE